jgi:hypothetical protein
VSDVDPRRSGLISAALGALAREDGAAPDATASAIPGGAVLASRDRMWAWLEERPEHALGAVIALAARAGSTGVTVLIPDTAGAVATIVARRAAQWALPIEVLTLTGRDRSPVSGTMADPEVDLPDGVEVHLPAIITAGADPVVEHGVLTGEVAGLEVCRVVIDDGGAAPRLEVGVGVHDREAFGTLHGDTPTIESLTRIAEVVRRHRRPGADPHPLNRLAPERGLRHRLVTDPAPQVAADGRPVPGVLARRSIAEPAPAHLFGTVDGVASLVACTTGVDLGAPVEAVDTFHWYAGQVERLVLVIPGRNRLPVLDTVAALSSVPIEIRTVDDGR